MAATHPNDDDQALLWNGLAGRAWVDAQELNIPARRPDSPGQFALADERRVHRIFEESGWADIDIRPIDVACAPPETELVLRASVHASSRPNGGSGRIVRRARC